MMSSKKIREPPPGTVGAPSSPGEGVRPVMSHMRSTFVRAEIFSIIPG